MRTTPSTLMVGIVLLTVVLGAATSLINEVISNEDITLSGPETERFTNFKSLNKTSEINIMNNHLSEATNTVAKSSDETNALSAFWSFIDSLSSSIWGTLTLVVGGLGFLGDILFESTALFGLPAWIPGLIVTLITLVSGFAIFYVIFKVRI